MRGAAGWRVKSSGPAGGDLTELFKGGGGFVCTDRPRASLLAMALKS